MKKQVAPLGAGAQFSDSGIAMTPSKAAGRIAGLGSPEAAAARERAGVHVAEAADTGAQPWFWLAMPPLLAGCHRKAMEGV
jgi:hypothetical protein